MTRTILIKQTRVKQSRSTHRNETAPFDITSDVSFAGPCYGWRCEFSIGVLPLQQKFVGHTEEGALLFQVRLIWESIDWTYSNRGAGYSNVGLINFY